MLENNINVNTGFVPPPPTEYDIPSENRFDKGPSPYKKSVVALLALFFGVYGVHDFYTKNKKRGILKLVLLFSVVGTVALPIISIVDIVKILNGSYLDGEGRELQ